MLDQIPADWPNRDTSEFVTSGTITWHLQSAGDGPVILFLHGAGASTHSWGPLMDELSDQFRCVAVDLPGHGFTSGALNFQLGLAGGAEALHTLLQTKDLTPSLIVGHSAGAAIAVTLAAKRGDLPIVAINGAFEAFEGWAGVVFPMIAKSMVGFPLVRDFFTVPLAQSADIEKLIGSTGTQLDEDGLARYRFLLKRRDHITGTLGMMSQWNLARDMPRGESVCSFIHFVQAMDDGTIAYKDTAPFRRGVIASEETVFDNGGHLIHEVSPKLIAPIIRDVMA